MNIISWKMIYHFLQMLLMDDYLSFSITANGLPLAAVGDFGAQNCQPSTNFDGSIALDLTTSTPIAANGC
ncbi:MAG: hypothetical protein KIS94_11405 [Chitinophagales bacterium]|nr:hypothetical protein [Chitinophagales bacterium]